MDVRRRLRLRPGVAVAVAAGAGDAGQGPGPGLWLWLWLWLLSNHRSSRAARGRPSRAAADWGPALLLLPTASTRGEPWLPAAVGHHRRLSR